MKSCINIEYVTTKDDLVLQGAHYLAKRKDVCVLHIHGMSGNIIENYYSHVIGEVLSANDIGFMNSHNRGYNFVNDIKTTKLDKTGHHKYRRIGATYEKFEESVWDIGAWVEKVKSLGYKKVFLFGHSLGANKVIYYWFKKRPTDISGIILGSPPDIHRKGDYDKKLVEEARNNIKKGNPTALSSKQIEGWIYLSAATLLEYAEEDTSSDNLPLARRDGNFDQLSSIDVPILAFMSEFDDVVTFGPKKDLEVIKKNAISCSDFEYKIIPETDHVYDKKEYYVAKVILEWVNKHI